MEPTLRLERIFDASPKALWDAWTVPEHYAKWLNPAPGHDLVIHEWDARPGGKVRFDMPQPNGDKNPQEGMFHSMAPHRELATGSADRSFLVRVTIEPVGARTRMVVEITGVPPEWREPAKVGWGASFDKLQALVVTRAVREGGSDFAAVAGGFTVERVFRATPERLWAMWTTREGLEQWWVVDGWSTRVTKLELRVGGGYELTMTDGTQTIRNHGTYTAVEPPARLAWIWRFDVFLAPGETPYDVPITVEFQAEGGGTRLRLRQGPLASPEFTEGSRQGVVANLEKLAKALGE